MTRKLGEAFVEIKANLEGLKSGLDLAKGLTSRAVAEMVDSLGLLDVALAKVRNVGLGLTAGVTLPVVIASRSFVSLGSAAEELENRFNVTFGDMAKDVREWSQTLAFAFGRSESETKQFISTFNKMLLPVGLGRDATAAMSKEMTALAFDLASFEDQRPEVVFQKLQSALIGMPRPLLEFGINVQDANVKAFALKTGISEVSKEMSEAQKVVARFGLILERSTAQQGDAIRTARGWANQWIKLKSLTRQLSENIGQSMIPTLGVFLRLLNDTVVPMGILITEFVKASPIISVLVTVLVGLVASIGPLIVATWAAIGLYIQWKVSAFVLKGALFALRIQIKGVTVANWLMNRSFVFTKAIASFLQGQFIRLKLALTGLAISFRTTALASISFASIWTGAAGIIAAGATLVAGAFRLMWAAILGPVGLAIIAITALVFLMEHLLAKKAMKGITEEVDAMNKALKALNGGVGGAGDVGGTADLGRTVSSPVLANISAGGAGFAGIFGGLAASIGGKPKGDQLVAGKMDINNELLRELVAAGSGGAVAVLN